MSMWTVDVSGCGENFKTIYQLPSDVVDLIHSGSTNHHPYSPVDSMILLWVWIR